MFFEVVRALKVADAEGYEQYRKEIAPLLAEAGGEFRFDFEVARVLNGPEAVGVNRLFVLRFPDRRAKERFFEDSRYLEIRSRLFDRAVERAVLVAEYQG